MFLFFLYTLSAMVICYLPLYLDERLFSKTEIGLMMGLALGLGTITNLISGILSDKWQRLKSLILVIVVLQGAVAAVMFTTDSKWLIFVAVQCFFLIYSPLPALSDSLIMIASKETQRNYISYRLWGSLGFALGAVWIGEALELSGIEALWWIYLSSALITSMLGLGLPDRKPLAPRIRLSELKLLIRSAPVYRFLILIFVLALSHRINDHYLGLFMNMRGADESIIGWAWLASALSEIPVFLLLAVIGHRFRPAHLLAVAALMYGLRFSLMAFVELPWQAVAIQCMHSVTFGIFLYASIAYLQQHIPDMFRATGQALFSITWVSLAGITASVLGGFVFEHGSAQALYLTAATIALLTVPAWLLVARTSAKSNPFQPPAE